MSDRSGTREQPSGVSAVDDARHVAHDPEPTVSREEAVELWRRAGGIGRVPVAGNSMAPLLHEGDHVRVRADVEVRIGDIVVALAEGRLVVHRLAARCGDQLVLRGDNTPAPDRPLPREAVLGRVTAVERGHGFVAGQPKSGGNQDAPTADPLAHGEASAAADYRASSAAPRADRLDGPLERAVGWLTVAYGRLQAALGRGPRPKWIGHGVRATADRVQPPMSPEAQLVLLTVRPGRDLEAADRIEDLLAGDLDWSCLLYLADHAQVGPLVHDGLSGLGLDGAVPDHAWQTLRARRVGSGLRSEQIGWLLERMLEALAAEGITPLGHKGIVLANTVYRDPALRIAGDIDLSVRDADRQRAVRAVAHIRDPLAAANPTRRDPAGHHVELDGTAHHDLEPSLFGAGRWACVPLDWDGIWARAERLSVGKHTLLVPAPTDLVLTLIANSIRRGFTPVRLVLDIATTLHHHRDEIDWAALTAELQRTGLDRRSWIALELAVAWFGVTVPAHVLEPPADLRIAPYERLLIDRKRRRPWTRLPTRVLWAGGYRHALAIGARMAWATLRTVR